MDELLLELSIVRDNQAALESRRRALEAQVFPMLIGANMTNAETMHGRFVQKITKAKEYADAVSKKLEIKDKEIKAIKDEQDAIKAQAENDGLVTITEKIGYDYKPNVI